MPQTTITKAIFAPIFVILLFGTTVSAQDKKNGFQYDSLRLTTGNNKRVDTSIQIVLYKADSAFRKGVLTVVINKDKTFGFKTAPNIPDSSKFKIGDLKDSATTFVYRFSVDRDSIDDRMIAFNLYVSDSTGAKKSLKNTSLTVFIKPCSTPLTSSSEFESWFFGGTNFDLFDGIKAQEFFFRANTFFHIHKNSYMQFAIYKNRYFISDSTTNNFVFQNNTPVLLRDSLYTYTKGYYLKKTRQTIDPLGLQFDYLYKLPFSYSSDEYKFSKSFFFSAGFDASTSSIIIENTFSDYDTITFRTKNQDSTYKGGVYPFPTAKLKYKTGVVNINIGFMYIYDNEKINFKAQFTTGLSYFNQLITLETKGGAATFQTQKNIYIQLRTFGTYKPLGVSIGFDVIKVKSNFLKVNATLSKVVDLDNFIKTFSPVNSLGVK